VTFGTIMEEFGMLTKLINPVLLRARTQAQLFATAVAIFVGDQYNALVLPARMFQKWGLQSQNLSRLAADAGTVTSTLIPWESCDAFVAVTLGVSTFLYFPFAVFNIASPFCRCFTALRASKLISCPPSPAPPLRRFRSGQLRNRWCPQIPLSHYDDSHQPRFRL
jgi:NhaC family Na+:H+ antiporter